MKRLCWRFAMYSCWRSRIHEIPLRLAECLCSVKAVIKYLVIWETLISQRMTPILTRRNRRGGLRPWYRPERKNGGILYNYKSSTADRVQQLPRTLEWIGQKTRNLWRPAHLVKTVWQQWFWQKNSENYWMKLSAARSCFTMGSVAKCQSTEILFTTLSFIVWNPGGSA